MSEFVSKPGLKRGVFTIPVTTPFLPALAAGILTSLNSSQTDLTDWRILLPTRRACRELRDSFVAQAGDRPLLLPRLQSIGDVDAEELDLFMSGFGFESPDIPQAVPSLERLFLLAQLVRQKDTTLTIDQSLALARGLARLIDQAHTEDVGFERLQDIVPESLSDHWQQTLKFLEIVTALWPAILAERNLIDQADRRKRLMKTLTAFWDAYPPSTPVLAAGSTGSIPMTAALLKTISRLPQGVVVLPGLDTEIDDTAWNEIGPTHPQATMRNLLSVMEVPRNAVNIWAQNGNGHDRRAVLRAVMAPAAVFGTPSPVDFASGMQGLQIIEARTAQEEAATIAVALRAILEDSDKTACFVTPDRILARRVLTALSRWGITVDDSAGGALAVTPSATFLGAILRLVQDEFAPLQLLDFIKHPLFITLYKDAVTAFEKQLLRGPRPMAGIEGLRRRVLRLDPSVETDIFGRMLDHLAATFFPLVGLAQGEHSIQTFCQALIQTAEASGGTAENFWAQPESETLASFLSGIMAAADYLPPLTLDLFVDVFHELLSQESYRATDPRHRRILFLGQLESRLIRRDVMILGGLNEATWPADPGHDPWMSRTMRRDFGLPTAERSVGLAAHDFVSHSGAEEVIITRSLKAEGAATVPARWLERWKTLLQAENMPQDWTQGEYLHWATILDKPRRKFSPLPVPAPCPPITERPQKLSVTAIEKWMNNPYRIYAERILKLHYLKPVDEDTTSAERGSFVHDILKDFILTYPGELPLNSRDILLDAGEQKFTELEYMGPHWHYWWPRFVRMVDWFLETETGWRHEATPWLSEKEAALSLYESRDGTRQFTLTAKADRLDRLKTGGAFVIDYKTGQPPSWTKVARGLAPQLPLEAMMVEQGAWGEKVQVGGFAYWRISGSHSGAGEVKTPRQQNMRDVIDAASEGIRNLVIKFEDAQTPYIALPPQGRIYDDAKPYLHLARTAEWASESAEADDDIPDGEAA